MTKCADKNKKGLHRFLGMYLHSFILQLEIKDADTSRSSLTLQDCASYPGIFVFLH